MTCLQQAIGDDVQKWLDRRSASDGPPTDGCAASMECLK